MKKNRIGIGLSLILGVGAAMSASAATPRTNAGTAVNKDPALWQGIYKYDDGYEGLYFFITEANETKVSGVYIYQDSGDEIRYGVNRINWDKEAADPAVASQIFQNQTSYVYYRMGDNGIFADYPQGWWADRYYAYVAPIEEAETIHHPQMQEVLSLMTSDTQEISQEASPSPFWGVWAYAAATKEECEGFAAQIRGAGLPAEIYYTTDWSNLNSTPWYVVSIGSYGTEAEAYAVQNTAHSAGFTDAYVKYSGDYQGSSAALAEK